MLLLYSSLIKIGGLNLNFVNEVETRATWKEMTATATIKIPKKVLVKGRDLATNNIADIIKAGDKVVIKLGYSNTGSIKTHFMGYVAYGVRPSIPLEIPCEDEMYVLKRTRVKQKVFSSAKLSDLIKYIAPNHEFDVLDTELSSNYSCLDYSVGTAAQALKKVERVFGLKSFFRLVPDNTKPEGVKPVLIVGRPYSSKDLALEKPVVYELRKNTKGDTLRYRFPEDNPIQIKGIVKVPNGKDLKYEYPPDLVDGSVQTRTFYGISLETLIKRVKSLAQVVNAEKYEGDITGFGVPFVRHGMVARIIDSFYEKRNALYFIDSVTTRASVSGGLEVISTIGYVVNDNTKNAME